MKILMLNYEFPPIGGGAGKAHLCLLREYAGNKELIIDVLTSAPEPGFTTEKLAENITIYKVGVHKKNLHYWRKVEVLEWLFKAGIHYRRLVRQNSFDLVHAFFGFPTGWLCRPARNSIPYIISLRGSDVPGLHSRLTIDYKILGPVFKAIWKGASAVIACSIGLKERALRFFPSVGIDVIGNGVELDRFKPPEQGRLTGDLRLITAGRLSVTKRIEVLIEAVKILNGIGFKVRLSIIGGGAMEQHYRRIVLRQQLADIVQVTGRVEPERMSRLYQDSDIFVSASMQEGMSNAMLEAMASGLPIITTRCEGVEELIAANGIVLDTADADEMAKAVMDLARDRPRYEQMSLEARKRAEQFSWPNVAKQYLDCYREVIERGAG